MRERETTFGHPGPVRSWAQEQAAKFGLKPYSYCPRLGWDENGEISFFGQCPMCGEMVYRDTEHEPHSADEVRAAGLEPA